MSRFILPLIALLFFVIESSVANLLTGNIFGGDKIIVPRFIMILIAFISVYGTRKMGIIYGLILGITYDVVYTEILGIYMFALPVFAILISKAMRILQSNLLINGLTSLVLIGVIEVVVYYINVLIGFASIGFYDFSMIRLIPTLLFNFVFLLVFSYPLKRLMDQIEIAGDRE